MSVSAPGYVARLRKGIATVARSVEIGPGTRVPPFYIRDIEAACNEVEKLRALLNVLEDHNQ